MNGNGIIDCDSFEKYCAVVDVLSSSKCKIIREYFFNLNGRTYRFTGVITPFNQKSLIVESQALNPSQPTISLESQESKVGEVLYQF